MIAILSPAKTLDFGPETALNSEYTLPRFTQQTKKLVEVLRTKTSEDLRSLMGISENIAELNVGRYQGFASRHTEKNAKACSLAFKGDVYVGLEAEGFDLEQERYAQAHLRILSGLYGLLRPSDLIQPYRLEMGTKLAFDNHKTLYAFWEDEIVKLLIKDLKQQGDDLLINLASNEYFKAIDRKLLKENVNVIDVDFKDFKNGTYKVISFFAKKARGMMAKYIIENRPENPEELKGFSSGGYTFDESASSADLLAFKRG